MFRIYKYNIKQHTNDPFVEIKKKRFYIKFTTAKNAKT